MEKNNFNDKYFLDESEYYRLYVPLYVIILLFWFAFVTFLTIYFIRYSFLLSLTILLSFIIMAIIFYNFYAGLKNSKKNFIVFEHNGKSQIYFCKKLYDKTYNVKIINKLKANRYCIILSGEILYTKRYYNSSNEEKSNIRHLRIPAYFENMDEIYVTLNRIIERSNGDD